MPSVDCYICRKHRGDVAVPGGSIYEDELAYVGHASIANGAETAYLGALLLEPKRHVDGIDKLSTTEAQRLGELQARIGHALRAVTGAEHIYLFVLGHKADHLHIWLVARYPGTPREYWPLRLDEWPEAPRGDAGAVAAFCERLRAELSVA